MTNPETYKRFICNWLQTILCQKNFSLTVQKQRKESLRRLSPLNILANHTFVDFWTTVLYSPGNYELFFWLLDRFTLLRKNTSWYWLFLFHPYKLYLTILKILELHINHRWDGISFYLGIRGNSAAGVFQGCPQWLTPFSNLKARVNKYL